MSWTEEMFGAMGMRRGKAIFTTNPWTTDYSRSGGGKDGMTWNQSLHPSRLMNERLSKISEFSAVTAADALGIREVRTMNDVNRIEDWLRGGGAKEDDKKKEEEPAAETDPTPETNEPEVDYQPGNGNGGGAGGGSPVNPNDPSGLDWNGMNLGFGHSTERFGHKDLIGNLQAGMTIGDMRRWKSSLDSIDQTRVANPEIQRILNGENIISAGFGQRNDMFGHQDLMAARAQGFNEKQILDYLDKNSGQLAPNNAKGAGVMGVYDEVAGNIPVDPKALMTGSQNLGNSAYSRGVRPNRSINSQRVGSSMGTTQYNRAYYGTEYSPFKIGGFG